MCVRNGAMGAVFADPALRRLLLHFAGRERSLGEVAEAAGLDLKRIHHQAMRLCRVGLLTIVGERRRGGRPIKLYRAVADSFFVPHEVVPKGFSDELARELRYRIDADAVRSGRGMLFRVTSDGTPRAELVHSNEAAARVTEMWRVLRLGSVEAKALTRELGELLDRYSSPRAAGDAYLIHAAVALRS